MRIVLAGGGSGGSVSPLLAVAAEIKKIEPKTVFTFIGTKKGPERLMARKAGISYFSIPAGKLRRYFSWLNLFSPLFTFAGFIKSLFLLKKIRPSCVFGTGSFVQVPIIWAAWFLRIPSVIHQQDYMPSLANSLCQFPAGRITVSFEDSLKDFSSSLGLFYKKYREKVILTGNPFRAELSQESREESLKHFHLEKDLPTLLVLGGGTGADFLNRLIANNLPKLIKTVQIIHSTGEKKFQNINHKNYKPYEFISEMGKAYAAADVVLCRAGLSTVTELSNLKKTAIVVPMPKSHQEVNAYYLLKKRAAVIVVQSRMDADMLLRVIKKILFDLKFQQELQRNISELMPKNAGKNIAKIILESAHAGN